MISKAMAGSGEHSMSDSGGVHTLRQMIVCFNAQQEELCLLEGSHLAVLGACSLREEKD